MVPGYLLQPTKSSIFFDFSYFFIVFYCFSMFFAAFCCCGWAGMVGDGPDVVGNGWDVMVKGLMLLEGGIFYTFLRFCD